MRIAPTNCWEERRGEYKPVNPHDHVNMGQSTNDIFPRSFESHAPKCPLPSLESLNSLIEAFNSKSQEFDQIVKSGRTHLQDASAIRLGQEFKAYASMLESDKCAVGGGR